MYTDVTTPNAENIRLLRDYDYVHVLGTRGDRIKRDPKALVKTAEEKKIAKEMVKQHNALLRSHGYNPKKRLNLSNPMSSTMRF